MFTRRMGSSPIDRTNYFIKYACSTDCYGASFFVDIVYNKAYNSRIGKLKVMAMRQKTTPADEEPGKLIISGCLAYLTTVLSRGWLLRTGICQTTCRYSTRLYLPIQIQEIRSRSWRHLLSYRSIEESSKDIIAFFREISYDRRLLPTKSPWRYIPKRFTRLRVLAQEYTAAGFSVANLSSNAHKVLP